MAEGGDRFEDDTNKIDLPRGKYPSDDAWSTFEVIRKIPTVDRDKLIFVVSCEQNTVFGIPENVDKVVLKLINVENLKWKTEDFSEYNKRIGVWKKLLHEKIVRLYHAPVADIDESSSRDSNFLIPTKVNDCPKLKGTSENCKWLPMCMEYVDGSSFYDEIRCVEEGEFVGPDIKQLLSQCLDVIEALCYIHDKHIAHRDIRSQNVHLTGNQFRKSTQLKLGHCEICKCLEKGKSDLNSRFETDVYQAPELLSYMGIPQKQRKRSLTEKCREDPKLTDEQLLKVDIYNLGILLNAILSYKTPFKEYEKALRSKTGSLDLLNKILDKGERPKKAIDINKDVPKDIQKIISKCWDKTPRYRPKATDVKNCFMEAMNAIDPSKEWYIEGKEIDVAAEQAAQAALPMFTN